MMMKNYLTITASNPPLSVKNFMKAAKCIQLALVYMVVVMVDNHSMMTVSRPPSVFVVDEPLVIQNS